MLESKHAVQMGCTERTTLAWEKKQESPAESVKLVKHNPRVEVKNKPVMGNFNLDLVNNA